MTKKQRLVETRQNSKQNLLTDSFKKQAIEQIYAGKPLTGKNGIFSGLIKDILETALSEELNQHLSQEKQEYSEFDHDYDVDFESGFDSRNDFNDARRVNNRRNGYNSKTLKTKESAFVLNTPRDRNGNFEPQIVKKNQTVLTQELDDKIIALYGLGMGYRDISSHMEDIYGINISKASITAITDKILPKIKEWQSRPLDEIYPIIFLDAMHFKCTDGGVVVSKAFYTVLGINQEGRKDVLGLYLSESEGANFWMGVLTDLNNRGVKDVLIACIDGLKGFPDAINSIFPKAEIQLCIIHQIRNSLKYVSSKNKKEFMEDLKLVYKAISKDLAESKLLDLEEKWGKKYPLVLKSWNNNWHNLSGYFKYPPEIRKMIYTTNAVEGLHRQIRKVTKTKGAFTSQQALEKLIFLAINNISKKWVMPVPNWSLIIGQLDIFFANRLKLDLA
ncbi:MAG: transposase-like protein [Rickettsiales bacterium]|jgi:transposase-like protein